MKRPKRTKATPAASKSWQKTPYANLIRYVPSGAYFARIRVGGKLIRQSLKTKVLSVAKLRLGDLEKQERSGLEAQAKLGEGNAAVRELVNLWRERMESDHSVKPRTKIYYEERLAALLKSWPSLSAMDVRKVSAQDCEQWAGKYAKQASSSSFNNTIGLLRRMFDLAIERGLRYGNPAADLKRVRVRIKELTLPGHDQFNALVAEIRRVPFGPGLASADLVEFLAYGGFRKGEAAHVAWADCDFKRSEILVRGNADTGTKNGEMRRVPMIPDMVRLLERLRAARSEDAADDTVMRVKECQGALTRACRKLGLPRITHHDLRHLFATRCIESGVDIPTVSRWLGHKDGGALAMKVYGHLRDQHSVAMAQKVSFGVAQAVQPAPPIADDKPVRQSAKTCK